MRMFRFLAGAGLAAALALTPAMAGDRPLQETLVIRIAQHGFAGVTGTEYRVAPNGDWRASRFVNERTTEVVGEGQLPAGTMIELSHAVAQVDFAAAAERIEAFRGVNPSMVEFRYGDETVTATLPPGFALDQPCPEAGGGTLCRLLELARLVEANVSAQ